MTAPTPEPTLPTEAVEAAAQATSDAETCALCRDDARETFDAVTKTTNLPLCMSHWNRWVIRFLDDPDAPCSAHLIQSEVSRG